MLSVLVVAELAKSFGNAENTESLGDFRYLSDHRHKMEAALAGQRQVSGWLLDVSHVCAIV